MALQGHARERVAWCSGLGWVIVRGDADDNAGVGVALVVRILAHAIGDDSAGLGRGGDDRTAGAHAEAVDGTSVAGVVHETVVRGTEQGVARVTAITRAID